MVIFASKYSLKGTLPQTRMGLHRETLPSKAPMRGHYVFLMAKSRFLSHLIVGLCRPYVCVCVVNIFKHLRL